MLKAKEIVLKSLKNKKPARISYGLVDTPFGQALLGFLCDKGNAICHLHFVHGAIKVKDKENISNGNYERALQQRWPTAVLVEDVQQARKLAHAIFSADAATLEVAVDGTPFQELVWQQLLEIPTGSTCTYAEIAERIGKPKAVRAVGNAVGSNEVSLLIPCHRVVSKDGHLKYRWGSECKRQMLAYESGK